MTTAQRPTAATKKPKHKAAKLRDIKPRVIMTDHDAVIKVLNRQTGNYFTEINHEALFDLASTHLSFAGMARILRVDPMLLEQAPYDEIIDRARETKRKELLDAQFRTAIQDRNPTMQIWLGKQYLGQVDSARHEHTGPGGKPMQVEGSIRMVAHMPPNGRDLDPSRAGEVRLLNPGEAKDAVEVASEPVRDDA